MSSSKNITNTTNEEFNQSTLNLLLDTATVSTPVNPDDIANKQYVDNTVSGGTTNSNIFTYTNTTDSSSTSTGAVVISGGLGVGKKINAGDTISAPTVSATTLNGTLGTAAQTGITSVGTLTGLSSSGAISTTSTTDSSSSSTGSITTAGGLGVSKKIYAGSNLHVNVDGAGGTPSVGVSPATNGAESSIGFYQNAGETGQLFVVGHNPSTAGSGNFGIFSSQFGGNAFQITGSTGNCKALSTTQSTSTTSGSLQVSGGMGVVKDVNIGGAINTIGLTTTANLIVNHADQSTSTSTGSITTTGGVGIVKDVYVGGTVNAPTVTATTLNGTLGTASQPNITGVGTLTSLGLSGSILTTSTTDSSSTGTGSIITAGGIGVAKKINAGDTISAPTVTATTLNGTLGTATQPNITSVGTLTSLGSSGALATTDATDSSSTTTGSITTAGGAGIVKNLFVGGTVTATNFIGSFTSTVASSISSVNPQISLSNSTAGNEASILFADTPNFSATNCNYYLGNNVGGLGRGVFGIFAAGTGSIGNAISINNIGNTKVFSTTDSSSTSTGALTVVGGLGIAKKIVCGDIISTTSTTDSTSITTGAIQSAGGLAVAKSGYIGSRMHVNYGANATATTPHITVSPQANGGESSIGFYRNVNEASDVWVMGHAVGGASAGVFGIYNSVLAGNTITIDNTGIVSIPNVARCSTTPSNANDLTNKTYVDTVAPSVITSTLGAGTFTASSSSYTAITGWTYGNSAFQNGASTTDILLPTAGAYIISGYLTMDVNSNTISPSYINLEILLDGSYVNQSFIQLSASNQQPVWQLNWVLHTSAASKIAQIHYQKTNNNITNVLLNLEIVRIR